MPSSDPHAAARVQRLFTHGFGPPPDGDEVGRVPPVPMWAVFQSLIVLAALTVLAGVSTLHWGGAYDHVAVPLMACAAPLWLAVCCNAVHSWFSRRRVGDWIDLCVVLFLAYAVFSFYRSEGGYPARLEYLWTWVYGGVFFAVRYGVHSRDWLLGWLVFVVLLAAGVCVFALMNRDNPTHLIWGVPRPNYGTRISGTFGCPNHFANFMAMAVFVSFLLGTYSRFPWPLRIVFFYLSILFTVGIFFSVSRGGYLAWIFGMTVITGYTLRTVAIRWWWKAAVGLALLTGIVLTIARNDFVLGRLEKTLGGDIRLQLIVDAFRIWNTDRWFGTGTATFDFYHMRLPDFYTGRAIYTHNDYMNTLSDYGAVGLGLVLLFLVVYAINHIIAGFSLRSEREALLWRVGLCSLLAMAAHEFVDFNLHIPACAVLFFSLLAMASARTFRQQSRSSAWLSAAPLLILAGLYAFIGVGPMVWQTWNGQRVAILDEEVLMTMEPSAIKSLADRVDQIDPVSTTAQLPLAHALRVQAARRHSSLRASQSRSLPAHQEVENMARDALAIYERLYARNPLDDSMLVKIGMTYDAIGRHDMAAVYYSRALTLRPHSGNFHFAVGHHFLLQGDLNRALESFRKASSQGVQSNPRIGEQVAEARVMMREIQKRLKEKNTR